ncbi:hypothetical protein TNCV_2649611 [Trichonephila clavipes]|nr:hypothetical protein TNCV_2649611 [Trichonephila clavipes]
MPLLGRRDYLRMVLWKSTHKENCGGVIDKSSPFSDIRPTYLKFGRNYLLLSGDLRGKILRKIYSKAGSYSSAFDCESCNSEPWLSDEDDTCASIQSYNFHTTATVGHLTFEKIFVHHLPCTAGLQRY